MNRRFLFPSILIAVGLVIGLVIAEALLRMMNIDQLVGHIRLFEHDYERGARHRPGAEGWWTKEGKVFVRINSDGLRDREHTIIKPKETIRIAVLGDSYAEAIQVEMEEAFWAVMERELKSCNVIGKRNIEVINFGVSGYGTGSELITLQREVWKYEPDIVLLAFLTGNDLKNNSYVLQQGAFLTYFTLKNNKLQRIIPAGEKLALKRDKIKRIWETFVSYSRLFQLAEHLRQTNKLPGHIFQKNVGSVEFGIEDGRNYLEPKEQIWRETWEVTEAIIKEINQEITARGKQMFFVTLSNGIQVHPEREIRIAVAKRLGVSDLFYPDRRLIHFVNQEGIPSVMLSPYLLNWAEKNQTCVHGFDNAVPCAGHWNEHGHQLAGKILSQAICNQVLNRHFVDIKAVR